MEYRHWMCCVLQPLNEKAADVIVNHLNLLEATYIDPLLLQFVAHVSSYRVILKRWEEGAINEWSAVSYPDKLPGYVEREFKRIKRKQAELLGIKAERRRSGTRAKRNDVMMDFLWRDTKTKNDLEDKNTRAGVNGTGRSNDIIRSKL